MKHVGYSKASHIHTATERPNKDEHHSQESGNLDT